MFAQIAKFKQKENENYEQGYVFGEIDKGY